MHRRDLLKLSAVLLGTPLSAACTRAVLSGADLSRSPSSPALTDTELDKVARIAELIIPETDTPGAVAAGVPAFVHSIVADWYTEEERSIFIEGLGEVDTLAREGNGRSFLAAGRAAQVRVLETLEANLANAATGPGGHSPFFTKIKELTVLGYYTSEVGSKQELLYRPVPGRYEGDALFDELGRQISL